MAQIVATAPLQPASKSLGSLVQFLHNVHEHASSTASCTLVIVVNNMPRNYTYIKGWEYVTSGWNAYYGYPPYYAYGKPLWRQWCNRTCGIFGSGEHYVRATMELGEEKAKLIQRAMRGALVCSRIKKYGVGGHLPLHLLSARVVVRTDIDLQQCRLILPRESPILVSIWRTFGSLSCILLTG